MSSNKKRLTEQDVHMESSSSDSSDEEGQHAEAYTGNEEIQVDFEGRNPIDSDFHGIKQLLNQLFLKTQINLSELTDLIIGQNYIGSIVHQSEVDEDEDDEDDDDNMEDSNCVFGITTAINLTNKQDKSCIQDIIKYVFSNSEKHATEATHKLIRDIFANTSKHVGFLLNERFINIPSQIAVPLLENLTKEVKRAADKKMPFNFAYYVMILKFYRQLAKPKKNKPQEDIYSNQEEEVFDQESVASFEFSVQSETDTGMSGDWLEGDSTLIPYRKVIVFDAVKLPTIINSIKEFIS